MITALVVLVAIAILGWGFYRARPFGKLGILAWLQSVVLMVPWLAFFGLFAVGIYLNLVVMLTLFVASTGGYIYLGKQVRQLGQELLKSSPEAAPPSPEAAPAPQAPVEVAKPASPDVSIPTQDLQQIKSIFGVDTFFATETIAFQDGAVFRGNLRGQTQASFAKLSAKLTEQVGDRYRLFLVEGQDEKPSVVVLPSSRDPQKANGSQIALSVGLMLITCATSFESASLMREFDLFSTPNRLLDALPVGLAIVSILAAHELGHWAIARRNQVRWSLPFFIPTLPLGALGSLNRFESLVPNRTVLFDVAFAGPAAGGLLSLLFLVIGLLLSHSGSLFKLPSEFFQGSILVGALSRILLGNALQDPIVEVHPLVVIGWLGLVVTALNLIPAGQLDGGRMIQAIYGRSLASRVTIGALVVLAGVALLNQLALYWGVVVFFLQRQLERPCQDDLTEPDDARAALALLALFLMIVVLVPLTPSMAGRLGIGAMLGS